MPIGDAAAQLGITKRTIRFFEERFLLSPFERVGKELYIVPRQFELAKEILKMQKLGLTITEIYQLVKRKGHKSKLCLTNTEILSLLARIDMQRASLDEQTARLRDLLAENDSTVTKDG